MRERAIGVIYRLNLSLRATTFKRLSLSDQFDAIVHFDKIFAVRPLERIVEKRAVVIAKRRF